MEWGWSKVAKKIVLTFGLITVALLLATGIALAGGSTIPHGGYDASSDACLQCHDVHEAASDYVLLRWETVQDTCGSCHFLYETNPPLGNTTGAKRSTGYGTFNDSGVLAGSVPAYNPGYSGDETRAVAPTSNSVGARTSAYERPLSTPATGEHNLQRGPGSFLFNDGKVDNASYIPGGFDRLTAIERANYPSVVNTLNFQGTNGLFCASCHTPHGNFGQLLKDSSGNQVRDKILSAKPNHSPTALVINNWATEGGKWCEKCHSKRVPEVVDPSTGDVYHNHPDQFCLDCHANYSGSNGSLQGSTDFPHTSKAPNLLAAEPDELCITCHQTGLLP